MRLKATLATAVAFCAVIIVGGAFLVPYYYSADRTQSGTFTRQSSGESIAAKQEKLTPSTIEQGQNSTSASRDIEKTAQPLSLDDEQRAQIRQYLAANKDGRFPDKNQTFSLSIGAAVPRQVQLERLPPELTQILHGFKDDDYVVVGNQLVIVDSIARRVVALIPGVS